MAEYKVSFLIHADNPTDAADRVCQFLNDGGQPDTVQEIKQPKWLYCVRKPDGKLLTDSIPGVYEGNLMYYSNYEARRKARLFNGTVERVRNPEYAETQTS